MTRASASFPAPSPRQHRPGSSPGRRWGWLGLLALLAALLSPPARAQTPPPADAPTRCTALARADWSQLPDAPTTVSAATLVAATPDLPAHCKVEGTIAPQIGFEVRLPMDGWNGRYLQQGCGGMCGWINMGACEDAQARGYATANTDMGHKGRPDSALWAKDNRPAQIDFGWRATYALSVAAKAIVERFYGRPPAKSYFRGCSTGGRQALVMAQRFPHAFDGIVAGAPVLSQTGVGIQHLLWSGRATLGEDGRPALTGPQVGAIGAAVLAACDGLDGLKDGILADPDACPWRPAALACSTASGPDCLPPAAIAAATRLYDGAPGFPGGMPLGSEHQWSPAFVGADGQPSIILARNGLIGDVLRYLSFWDAQPQADPLAFDFVADAPRLKLIEPIFNAQNPDLSAFAARGGKLILWHGWDDLEVPVRLSIAYIRAVERAAGGPTQARAFFRAFLLPGVAHCRRGPGADSFDELSAIEAWVERGQGPDVITAHKLKREQSYLGLPRPRFPLAPADVAWTRPVPAWPLHAVRRGRGDPADARSWRFAPLKVAVP